MGSMATQLGLGRLSWLSPDRDTERALGLAQTGGPAQLCSSPILARSAIKLGD